MSNSFMTEDPNDIYNINFEDNEFPFDEDDIEDDFDPASAEEQLAEIEQDINDISFETDAERNKFCDKYSKLMRSAGYDEDVIDEKIEDIQNGTMTREDLCIYYNCDDAELDDVMDCDRRD